MIVGGSHSGFSCAFMLLNGPTHISKNEKFEYDNMPTAVVKRVSGCKTCCHCVIKGKWEIYIIIL